MAEEEFTTLTDTCLEGFEGFYDSIWSPDDDLYYYDQEESVEYDKDYTFDYERWNNEICRRYTEIWQGWMKEYIHQDIELEFMQVSSPRFYNYETDKCEVCIKLTHQAKKAIIAKMQEYRKEIGGWIKENHTSCSGFVSFLSNNIDDWGGWHLFNDDDFHQPAYLSCALYYIVKAAHQEAGYTSERLEIYAYDDIMEEISFRDYIEPINHKKTA